VAAYLGKQEAFYHPASGHFLKEKGFNNTFASKRGFDGPLGSFLTAGGYITIVHDLTYDPKSTALLFERDGLTWFNTYRAPLIEPLPGDTTPLNEFLGYLVPDEAEREHLLRVIAWTIRHPGEKVRHAIMIRSEYQGIGKSILADIWKAMVGESNARTVSSEEIAGNTQGFLQESVLNVIEELALGSGRQFYNRMKDWITGNSVRINEKYLARREWPNLVTFLVLTNLKIPILIEDTDRRFFMVDTPAEPRPAEYYRGFSRWWQSNLGLVRTYFDEVDLGGFDPYAQPPATEAKRLLIADGRTDLEKDLALAIRERFGVFDRDLVTFEEIESELGRSTFGKSKTQLVNALHAVGAVKLGQKWVKGSWTGEFFVATSTKRRASLWAVRNAAFWGGASAKDCEAEYARRSGFFAEMNERALDFLFEYMVVRIHHGDEPNWADLHYQRTNAGEVNSK
jgi:hypothetical protein